MSMTEQEVKDLLIKTNAIMNGHFLLTSGLHSPHYVEKFNVLQHPRYTQQLCEAMAEKFKDANIETVVGPVTGGILLAHETGKALGTRAIFTERENGKMTFRRGFTLHPGERCLIVEDIVTTGGSSKKSSTSSKPTAASPLLSACSSTAAVAKSISATFHARHCCISTSKRTSPKNVRSANRACP